MGPPVRVQIDVSIRPCRRDDLLGLEWWGVYRPHRDKIRRTFRRHCRGDSFMLVADGAGTPVGQVWIDFPARPGAPGYMWALRVFPCFQGQGLGTRLIAAAESVLVGRGFTQAEINVERNNPGARRLYERLGYRYVGVSRRPHDCTWHGMASTARVPQWVLRKSLVAAAENGATDREERRRYA
jgi:ribosomal protein S18 acetylase RimI-like enzyme